MDIIVYAGAMTRDVAVLDDLHADVRSSSFVFLAQPSSSCSIARLAFASRALGSLGTACCFETFPPVCIALVFGSRNIPSVLPSTMRRVVGPHRLAILTSVRAAPPSARSAEREGRREPVSPLFEALANGPGGNPAIY